MHTCACTRARTHNTAMPFFHFTNFQQLKVSLMEPELYSDTLYIESSIIETHTHTLCRPVGVYIGWRRLIVTVVVVVV